MATRLITLTNKNILNFIESGLKSRPKSSDANGYAADVIVGDWIVPKWSKIKILQSGVEFLEQNPLLILPLIEIIAQVYEINSSEFALYEILDKFIKKTCPEDEYSYSKRNVSDIIDSNKFLETLKSDATIYNGVSDKSILLSMLKGEPITPEAALSFQKTKIEARCLHCSRNLEYVTKDKVGAFFSQIEKIRKSEIEKAVALDPKTNIVQLIRNLKEETSALEAATVKVGLMNLEFDDIMFVLDNCDKGYRNDNLGKIARSILESLQDNTKYTESEKGKIAFKIVDFYANVQLAGKIMEENAYVKNLVLKSLDDGNLRKVNSLLSYQALNFNDLKPEQIYEAVLGRSMVHVLSDDSFIKLCKLANNETKQVLFENCLPKILKYSTESLGFENNILSFQTLTKSVPDFQKLTHLEWLNFSTINANSTIELEQATKLFVHYINYFKSSEKKEQLLSGLINPAKFIFNQKDFINHDAQKVLFKCLENSSQLFLDFVMSEQNNAIFNRHFSSSVIDAKMKLNPQVSQSFKDSFTSDFSKQLERVLKSEKDDEITVWGHAMFKMADLMSRGKEFNWLMLEVQKVFKDVVATSGIKRLEENNVEQEWRNNQIIAKLLKEYHSCKDLMHAEQIDLSINRESFNAIRKSGFNNSNANDIESGVVRKLISSLEEHLYQQTLLDTKYLNLCDPNKEFEILNQSNNCEDVKQKNISSIKQNKNAKNQEDLGLFDIEVENKEREII